MSLRWIGEAYRTAARAVSAEDSSFSNRERKPVTLENKVTKLTGDLECGLFGVVNKADGSTVVRDAAAGINGVVFDGDAERTWKRSAVLDAPGTGESFTVTTPGKRLDLIQVFTRYSGRSAVAL
jgi:hypothetical protein